MFRIYALVASLLTSSACFSAAPLVIDYPQLNLSLQYPQAVRLEKALGDAQIQLNKNAYSLQDYVIANRLFNQQKKSQAEQLQRRTVSTLRVLGRGQTALSPLLDLADQVASWNVGYRERLSLDIDEVRITPASNPMLRGHFSLIAPPRSKTITIAGLIHSPSQTQVKAGNTAADYLNNALLLPGANKSFAWLIYPDGETRQIGYAYWNDERTPVPPGSTLYIGFDAPSAKLQLLEQDIVLLIGWKKDIK